MVPTFSDQTLSTCRIVAQNSFCPLQLCEGFAYCCDRIPQLRMRDPSKEEISVCQMPRWGREEVICVCPDKICGSLQMLLISGPIVECDQRLEVGLCRGGTPTKLQ